MKDVLPDGRLPCGLAVNISTKGECCLLNCPDPAIRREQDTKKRCWLVNDCRHWAGRSVLQLNRPKEGSSC